MLNLTHSKPRFCGQDKKSSWIKKKQFDCECFSFFYIQHHITFVFTQGGEDKSILYHIDRCLCSPLAFNLSPVFNILSVLSFLSSPISLISSFHSSMGETSYCSCASVNSFCHYSPSFFFISADVSLVQSSPLTLCDFCFFFSCNFVSLSQTSTNRCHFQSVGGGKGMHEHEWRRDAATGKD